MTTEFTRRYRPSKWEQVVGQPEAVKILRKFVSEKKVPHAIIFQGPSGCGKTTLARILQSELDCDKGDFCELNCADVRGIETIRDIRRRMGLAALGGSTRIWLIDEAHQLTTDAQNSLLKMLEEPPPHVYFMLATTNPNKLIKTIQTRCTPITLKPVHGKAMEKLILQVLSAEKKKVTDEVIERLVDVADGSPRAALVLLEEILNLDDDEQQLNVLLSSDVKQAAIEIYRKLISPYTKWGEMATILNAVEEEPERIRHLILACATTTMLKGGKNVQRAYLIIDCFRDHWYDCKKAGLVAACFQVINTK